MLTSDGSLQFKFPVSYFSHLLSINSLKLHNNNSFLALNSSILWLSARNFAYKFPSDGEIFMPNLVSSSNSNYDFLAKNPQKWAQKYKFGAF